MSRSVRSLAVHFGNGGLSTIVDETLEMGEMRLIPAELQ